MYSLGNSNLDKKRWKKFLHGSGMVMVPNSDTTMRSYSVLAWKLSLVKKRLLYVTWPLEILNWCRRAMPSNQWLNLRRVAEGWAESSRWLGWIVCIASTCSQLDHTCGFRSQTSQDRFSRSSRWSILGFFRWCQWRWAPESPPPSRQASRCKADRAHLCSG